MVASSLNTEIVSHSDKMKTLLQPLGGCTDLSLGSDPDRQRAIVPPLIHKLSLIVRLLLKGGCVEPHVVDYPMILYVAPYT